MVGGKEGRFRNQLVWQEVQFGGDANKKGRFKVLWGRYNWNVRV